MAGDRCVDCEAAAVPLDADAGTGGRGDFAGWRVVVEQAPGPAARTAKVLGDVIRRKRALDVELKRLSPEARTEVETNIQLIQTAIHDINQALEKEPDNVLLQQQLLNAYHEELTLLRRVGGLTRSIMARNDI